MEIKTCRNCGCIFNYVGFGPSICPNCKDTLEAKFQEVKEYVWNNKGVNIATVAEDCDVSEQQIREWIREERLEFATGDFGLSCEKCGRTITLGRFCEKCKASMVKGLTDAIKKDTPVIKQNNPKDDGGPKMRFVK